MKYAVSSSCKTVQPNKMSPASDIVGREPQQVLVCLIINITTSSVPGNLTHYNYHSQRDHQLLSALQHQPPTSSSSASDPVSTGIRDSANTIDWNDLLYSAVVRWLWCLCGLVWSEAEIEIIIIFVPAWHSRLLIHSLIQSLVPSPSSSQSSISANNLSTDIWLS